MTTIAHPAQGLIRRSAFDRVEGYQREIDHGNADKSLWFYLSHISDYAYLREKLCCIRINSGGETSQGILNFQHPILCHLMINEYARFAEHFDYPEVLKRKNEALERLSKECLGYSVDMLKLYDFTTSKAYIDYARILFRNITDNELWNKISKMCDDHHVDAVYLENYKSNFKKNSRNYDPPSGFIAIK